MLGAVSWFSALWVFKKNRNFEICIFFAIYGHLRPPARPPAEGRRSGMGAQIIIPPPDIYSAAVYFIINLFDWATLTDYVFF